MENIAKLRRMHKMTQTELGKFLGVSTSTIAMWETGKRKPNYHMIVKLCDRFGVTFEEVTGASMKHSADSENIKIPVYGSINNRYSEKLKVGIVGYENINGNPSESGDYFGLMIRDDSMEPKMNEGDTVIAKRHAQVQTGQIVVVAEGKENAQVRKVSFQNGGITLTPTNPDYMPIFYTKQECEDLPVTILGKVIELRCKYR